MYASILRPPQSKCDVCYWVNKQLQDVNSKSAANQYACINCAVEATMLRKHPLAQDNIVSDCIQQEDVLVCSIGTDFKDGIALIIR